ncbi:replication-relaxation family protein [Streptantibioticus ferralitis]|uniref:Replication-relaxation family protein n=1 Tax=Streptantibioticus ferralitis TaxID=236510 RepID=A0ABT5Z3V6_9ACTN|nr:replication-relaxation family protein [Streptantibioticus ferralitis]MDF2258347.1 replication-relaxation family protein [Streptantibioticus ferralitis]
MITNPTPQRALRGHKPRRTQARAAVSGEYVAWLAPRLTDRDRWLAHMLYEHKVLTTNQIAQIGWPSARAANLRLLQLYKWRVIDRFQPFVNSGSAPMHYILDLAGAAALARGHGVEVRELDYRHDRAMGMAYSLRLAHTVGTNSFFAALTHHSRRPEATGRLTAWWSEYRCYRHFGDMVRPDAYGRWHEGHIEFEWFLEYDFGTERPADRVGAKLAGYARLAATTGITTPVLLWLPTTDREAQVRRALAAALSSLHDPSLVPVATSSAELIGDPEHEGPAGAHWLPLDTAAGLARKRQRLAQLSRAWPQLAPVSTASPTTAASSSDPAGPLPPPAPLPPDASCSGPVW